MVIYRNVSLKKYNTFGLDYLADSIIHAKNEKDTVALFRGESFWKKPLLILGSGSNILFTSDFKGTILHPEFGGIRFEKHDKENVFISAGAGVNWDKLVEWTVNKGYCGLENLSLIPGLTGAAPVQNIGAYGAEVNDSIEKVKTISTSDGSIRVFSNEECKFGYRKSIFKNSERGKYLITRVYYKLSTYPLLNLTYGSLEEELNKLGPASLKNVRQAVINIRRRNLPDPDFIGNAGSFFKNPVIEKSYAQELSTKFPLMPTYHDPSGDVKVAAGWLIEQCGWKGKKIGDAAVYENQSLVLVNLGKASGKDIFNLSERIRESVLEKFGIELEREVEVIGTI
jgi:UDP-N-acetylmuramate dehydrogenase